ncbi:hypothetical protein ACM66Z_09270 [Sulfurovum sp. ST-21]|uniref:Copper resistance protein D domain-containing protein n=1 Tax=Sulfurovum indicum TaxID=2779528 RepID=A0A7M1S2Q2_9BACT|nr:hypothetical protein [Sulfurovum indicum]QOR61616.1 hypothetical protein IMZ28_09255 [Sulfurovum indicum]
MYTHIVVFLHVLSAFVWVGGMIAIRVAVHPVLQSIEEPKIKLGKTLQITGRLFHLVIPFILTLLATGLMMAIASNGHHGILKSLFLSKEVIWTVMVLNFIYMYVQRRSAWKLFEAGKLPEAKAKVKHIPNLLLPVNIVLGVVALYLGVSLRGL